jgi:hypothetical protein
MTITVVGPENYGYVILSCVLGQFICSEYMALVVLFARKSLRVPLPNAYATPGIHANADAFNRIQRGHMSYFETLGTFTAMALIGGLKHPVTTIVSSVLYNIGSVLFQVGYSDTKLDVEVARYKKGGALKWVGMLGVVGTFMSCTGSMCGWWGKTAKSSSAHY